VNILLVGMGKAWCTITQVSFAHLDWEVLQDSHIALCPLIFSEYEFSSIEDALMIQGGGGKLKCMSR
jgi:hypothetical protein